MANPEIPIQAGSNLPSLEREDTIHNAEEQDDDLEAYADSLGLDSEDIEQEVIELEDGSVIVNFQEKQGPQKNPEFYENLAEVFDEGTLQSIAIEYLDYIDVDQESRKQRDKQYEEGLRRTGLGKDAPGGATFDGASKVVHPVMAESCVDFAAVRATKARRCGVPAGGHMVSSQGFSPPSLGAFFASADCSSCSSSSLHAALS